MRGSFEELTGMRVDFTNIPALILAGASVAGWSYLLRQA